MLMTAPRGRGRPRKNVPHLDAAQEELVQIRQQLGMTQEAFAEALGVHADTISRWERGERRVSQMALKLARSILAAQ